MLSARRQPCASLHDRPVRVGRYPGPLARARGGRTTA